MNNAPEPLTAEELKEAQNYYKAEFQKWGQTWPNGIILRLFTTIDHLQAVNAELKSQLAAAREILGGECLCIKYDHDGGPTDEYCPACEWLESTKKATEAHNERMREEGRREATQWQPIETAPETRHGPSIFIGRPPNPLMDAGADEPDMGEVNIVPSGVHLSDWMEDLQDFSLWRPMINPPTERR